MTHMRKLCAALLLALWAGLPAYAQQQLKSPEAFLGYPLGSKFSYYHQIVGYFQHIAQQSDKVALLPYGHTEEGRSLQVAVVSAPKNIQRLESLRLGHLAAAGLAQGKVEDIPVIWLSYNIHGCEASASETAMALLHELTASQSPQVKAWLEDALIVIDPCENPDGHERYVGWYNQKVGKRANAQPDSWEHMEPWPTGRYNHYVFDLNRDWAWQVQKENQQRLAFYRQWMPHVHIDVHEMGAETPYFFGPAAEPIHRQITDWQRNFHEISGRNHAKHFDKRGWIYFSKERFDLFYPSYGDTWPSFQGSVGFTFEQGGNSRAGLAYRKLAGDTLTLKERVDKHFVASVSGIEASFDNRKQLMDEQVRYFKEPASLPYRSFVVSAKGAEGKVRHLTALLDKQGIRYGFAKAGGQKVKGYVYGQQGEGTYEVNAGDLVVDTRQPLGRLAHVLFEPQPELSDSVTYDLTSWSLPYVYNMEAVALKASGLVAAQEQPARAQSGAIASSIPAGVPAEVPMAQAYAYVLPWKDLSDAKLLAALQQQGIKARYATYAFTTQPMQAAQPVEFAQGTLVVSRMDNPQLTGEQFDVTLRHLHAQHAKTPIAVASGMVSKGYDFGSSTFRTVEMPKVAILGGEGTTPTNFGETWFFFEEQLGYPSSVFQVKDLGRIKYPDFDVLVVPDGHYGDREQEQLLAFAQQGGTVIALDEAVALLGNTGKTALGAAIEAQKKNASGPKQQGFADQERESISDQAPGNVCRLKVDNTHPLGYGLQQEHFQLKKNQRVYPLLERGWNAATYAQKPLVSGFMGYKLKQRLPGTMAVGTESYGRGNLVYFAESPLFRGFVYGDMISFCNALFFKM